MKLLLSFLLLIVLQISLMAQVVDNNENQNTLFDPVDETLPDIRLFGNDEPLDLTLKYDITSFIRHKSKGEYLDAELKIHLSKTDSIVKNIRLKARGNFRRGQCLFPPIYLNFKTDPLKSSELEGIKKIKMVTHCSSGKSSDSYILKEYLAYKLYNLITEKSFRVKLLNITYIDTGKKQRNYERMGFLIEPLDLVVNRTNSVEVDGMYIKEGDVIPYDADIVALFEYFIANTDWRIKSGHNMKYIKSLDHLTQKVTPVPYDFDFSGFVGTHYSAPQEWTNIKSVRDREYLGYCREDDDDYRMAIAVYRNKKEELLETIRNFNYLKEKERNELVKFCHEFFDLVEKPDVFVKLLQRQCRTDF